MAFDAFDAKAEALALARGGGRAGRQPAGFSRCRPDLAPGPVGALGLGPKTIVARFGELHPGLVKSLGAPPGAVAAEIYLDAIPAPRRAAARAPPSRRRRCSRSRAISPSSSPPIFPPTLCSAPSAAADKAAIADARLFDRFETADGLSLAVEVTLQPGDKSFTDEQIGEISRRIVAAAEKLGARLRSLIERVDRGVDARLDLVAWRPGRNCLADLERDRPARWMRPAAPQPPAVDRDRHHRQAKRAVEPGKTRT